MIAVLVLILCTSLGAVHCLEGGQIASIVIAAVILIAVLGMVLYLVCAHRQSRPRSKYSRV